MSLRGSLLEGYTCFAAHWGGLAVIFPTSFIFGPVGKDLDSVGKLVSL